MRKDFCDICEGGLYVKRDTPMGMFSTKYEFKEISIFPMMLCLPFTGNIHNKKLEVCSRCFDDFQEYVQRKKHYINDR